MFESILLGNQHSSVNKADETKASSQDPAWWLLKIGQFDAKRREKFSRCSSEINVLFIVV
jgi:hypothetical protein